MLFRFGPLFLVTHSKNLYLRFPRFLTMGSPFRTTSWLDGILTFHFSSFEFQDLHDETIYHVPVFFTFHQDPHKVSDFDALSKRYFCVPFFVKFDAPYYCMLCVDWGSKVPI